MKRSSLSAAGNIGLRGMETGDDVSSWHWSLRSLSSATLSTSLRGIAKNLKRDLFVPYRRPKHDVVTRRPRFGEHYERAMKSAAGRLPGTASGRRFGRWLRPTALGLGGIAVTVAVSIATYLLHFNLSAIGSVYLLLVVLVTLRWGFTQATVISIAAVFCLNYLFIPPLFEFQIADHENFIAIIAFESAALIVSGVSSKLRRHAEEVELERARTAKLYELSRAILLIDGQSSTSEQLSPLIRELIQVEEVEIWDVYELGPPSALQQAQARTGSALETYLSGTDSDDTERHITRRVLKLGTRPIGAIVLQGSENDPLLADAVASLTAVAIERARAIQKETRAEAERNTEQLRTAVLDGLAHGFKTPLTAIQTASSGLLEINEQLTPTQAELISIIDEQATALSQLTTRLLQTAALEATEIRLRRSKVSIVSLLEHMIEDQEEATRARVTMHASRDLSDIEVDAQLVHLALLQLIENAAVYSTKDCIIDVTVTQDERETMVVVANSGPSIRPEDMDRIFERFYRGSEASKAPKGTGLGLSILKKTAEAHGGRAWAECDGGMTRFFVTFSHYRGKENG